MRTSAFQKTPMKTSLHPGLVLELSYRVTDARTPWTRLLSESDLPRPAPASSANDTMLGLVRWACMEAMRIHGDAGEHSVGLDTQILSASTVPAGLVARVEILVEKVDGRKISFRVKAYDEARPIGEGTHERFVIDRERFAARPARPGERGSARSRRHNPSRGGRRSVG
jgi:fluoroacetyl-CoA thioesterase